MKHRAMALFLALATALMVPGMAAAADRSVPPSEKLIITVTPVFQLSGENTFTASTGPITRGCYYAATNILGNVVYSYTIWQTFSYDGTNITYFPPPSHSSTSDLGWVLTSASDSHWWITQPRTAAARGNWTFTQYVGGQPYKSASGWVQININGNGSTSCSSS